MNAKGNITTTSYLDWDEFLSLLDKLKEDNKTKTRILYAAMGYTGLRIGDVLKLKWGDLLGDEITLKEQKTGKTRTITVKPELRAIAEESKSGRPSSLAFRNKWGKPITRSYVNIEMKRVFSKYNVVYKGNISSHLFRKTLGRRYLEVTDYDPKSLILLMELFNHSSLETTKRYLGIRQEEIAEIYTLI